MARTTRLYQQGLKIRKEIVGPGTVRRIKRSQNIAPVMDKLANEICYGTLWARTDKLDLRSRRWLTIATLICLGKWRQLKTHMKGALRADVTKHELGEAITHMAIYLGVPQCFDALQMARDAVQELEDEANPKAKKRGTRRRRRRKVQGPAQP